MTTQTKRDLIKIWKQIGLAGLIIGFSIAVGSIGSKHPPMWDEGVILGSFVWLAFPFVIWKTHQAVNVTWDAAQVAATPIPSPLEIELALRREGYDPSLQDVAAVHQMLVQRRNEGLATAAIGFGALYLVQRNLHH